MRNFASVVARIARACQLVAGVSLASLAVLQLGHVAGRYVFNFTPSWTEPVSIVLMSMIMLFGAAYAVHRGSHFAFTVGIDHLDAPTRRRAQALVQLVVAAVGLMLAWEGIELTRVGWDVKSAGVSLPQGLVFVPVILGGALIGLFGISAALGAGSATQGGDAERVE